MKKLIAIWMSVLILTIPFYTSSVFADIESVTARGSDNIDGFAKKRDYVDFEVLANLDDGTVLPENVVLLPATNFDTCEIQIGHYKCNLRYPAEGDTDFNDQTSFTINLKNTDGTIADTDTGSFYVDDEAPTIQQFSISPELTSSDTVDITFSVRDTSSVSGRCSGISKLEIYKDDSLADTIEIDSDRCSYSDTAEFTTADTGSISLCAKAYDNFNIESDAVCDDFIIDVTGPSIESAELSDEDGNTISYKGTQDIEAIVEVTISGTFDEDTIWADLSSLNDNSRYKNITPQSFRSSSGKKIAKWELDVDIEETLTPSIKVFAEDNLGNFDEKDLSLPQITYDTEGPVVNSLYTDISDSDGEYYLRADNNIIYAEITDSGIGYNETDVYLSIGSSTLKPESCVNNLCIWEDISISSSGTIEPSITTQTEDILGNNLDEAFSSEFIIDTSKPSFVDIAIIAVGGEQDATPGFVAEGDSLYISINLTTDELTSSVADLSAVIEGASSISADSCEELNNKINCIWTTSSIDKEGPINDHLEFNFTDFVGNTLTYSYPISVYGIIDYDEDEEGPNYWSSSIQCSPRLIDRQVTTLVNQEIYCHIPLTSSETDIEILEMAVTECLARELDSTENGTSYGDDLQYIQDIELLNAEAGSTDPYLKLTLVADPFSINSIEFTCDLAIISRLDQNIIRTPEFEEIPIIIGFYNMPLGEVSDNLNEKIEDAKDFSVFLGDWVDTMNQIFHYGEKLCQLIGTFLKIINMLNAVSLIISEKEITLWGVASVNPLVQPGADATTKARAAVQKASSGIGAMSKEGWGNYIVKFCKFFSCDLFYDDIWGEAGPGGDGITDTIGNWQRGVLEFAGDVQTAWQLDPEIAYSTTSEGTSPALDSLHPSSKLEPKDSIVLSFLTLCIPGIIYHLSKLRQIQCMYADCMETYVEYGLPLKACEDMKHYAECKYWWGEIFQLAPITGLLNYASNLIKKALSNPLFIIDVPLGIACSAENLAEPLWGVPGWLCLTKEMFGLVADVACDLGIGGGCEAVWDGWKIEGNYCE